MGPDVIQEHLIGAASLADMVWRLETSGRRLETPEERPGWRAAFGSVRAQIKDEIHQRQYLSDFKDRLCGGSSVTIELPRQGRPAGGRKKRISLLKNRVLPSRLIAAIWARPFLYGR